MGKRRNRQPDVVNEASEDSSESEEPRNPSVDCPHVSKSTCPSKLFGLLKKNGIAKECQNCKQLGCNKVSVDDKTSTPPPALWICLRCAHQSCGELQKNHAEQHYKTPRSDAHYLAMDTQCWSIWCYKCETRVRPDLSRRLHLSKIVEFSKKIAASSVPINKKAIPLPPADMGIKADSGDAQKTTLPLDGLTKVVGLSNLGNTCFFNAVLQCLNQTPFLVKILEDMQEPGEKFVLPGGTWKTPDGSQEGELDPIDGTLGGWGTFTATLCKTLKTMQSMKTNQTFSPQELLSTFKKKTMQCMDGGQHDSHELLRHLLEHVRNEDLRRYHSVILEKLCGKVKVSQDSVDEGLKARIQLYGRHASARFLGPDLVFRGVLVSTLECLKCHHSSQRTEPFLDLSLPVMADKPQPPVLKRRNSGLEESFDSMGNDVSAGLPAQQPKSQDKTAAQRRRVRRRSKEGDENYARPADKLWNLFVNSISEENPSAALQLESDADVEDNISAPEVVESGYSSEKVSTVTSPVSPTDPEIPRGPVYPDVSQVPTFDDATREPSFVPDYYDSPSNVDTPLSPTEPSDSLIATKNDGDSSFVYFEARDTTNMTMNLNEITLHNSLTNWPDSPGVEGSNDIGDLTGVSPSTSLIVNSELSPEAATISPLSSPATSEDSPTSPPSSATDGENAQTDNMHPDMIEFRSIIENTSRKNEVADPGTPDRQTSQPQSPESPEIKIGNGVDDIASGLSKVAVTGGHSSQPTRYYTKEGEWSIQSCLNQFTALEFMTGSNEVGCEACTKRENKGKESSSKMVCTRSTKQYLISRVPAVLILHLKRFQSQSQRMGFRKVTKHVGFPVLLDLAPVCKGGGKPKIYSLYGVVVHSGSLHGGHYIAYVKTRPPLTPEDPRWAFLSSKDSKESSGSSSSSSSDNETEEAKSSSSVEPPPGRWYGVSDSRVTEVEESEVLESQAYILFYERIL